MGITMQGHWTLQVKSSSSACLQRFTIAGADLGNGTYDTAPGMTVPVTGARWTVSFEHRVVARPWCESRARIGLPIMAGGLLRLELTARHGAPDQNHLGALVLSCTAPAQAAEHVVYGSVKGYSGAAFFNPCRHDYIVIDPPLHLGFLCARYPQLCAVIERLYPERLRAARSGARQPANPTPIVLPTGLPNVANGLVFEPGERDAAGVSRVSVRRAPFKATSMQAGAPLLSAADLQAIAEVRDAGIRLRSEMAPAAALQLAFQQYHHTPAERQGAAYHGHGRRDPLGNAITDDLGNYVFRFSPAEPMPAGQRPHLLVQIFGAAGVLSCESAPYDNVSNLVRIDLCVPAALVPAPQPALGTRVPRHHGDVAWRGVTGRPEPLALADRSFWRHFLRMPTPRPPQGMAARAGAGLASPARQRGASV